MYFLLLLKTFARTLNILCKQLFNIKNTAQIFKKSKEMFFYETRHINAAGGLWVDSSCELFMMDKSLMCYYFWLLLLKISIAVLYVYSLQCTDIRWPCWFCQFIWSGQEMAASIWFCFDWQAAVQGQFRHAWPAWPGSAWQCHRAG